MKAKFSVVMTSFNHGRFIAEAIRSVLKQTFVDWELVIVDDASTDDSVQRIRPFLKDKRIRFWHRDRNQGYGQNTREVIQKAQAPIIGILDSDDSLTSQALATMYLAHQKNKQAGLIYSQFRYANADLSRSWLGDCRSIPLGKSNLQVEVVSHFKTFKRRIYNLTSGINPSMENAEDFDLVLKLEEMAPIIFINRALYNYRLLANSLSHLPKQNKIGLYSCILAKYEAYQRRLGTPISSLSKIRMIQELTKGLVLAAQLKDKKRAKNMVKFLQREIF